MRLGCSANYSETSESTSENTSQSRKNHSNDENSSEGCLSKVDGVVMLHNFDLSGSK